MTKAKAMTTGAGICTTSNHSLMSLSWHILVFASAYVENALGNRLTCPFCWIKTRVVLRAL